MAPFNAKRVLCEMNVSVTNQKKYCHEVVPVSTRNDNRLTCEYFTGLCGGVVHSLIVFIHNASYRSRNRLLPRDFVLVFILFNQENFSIHKKETVLKTKLSIQR